MIVIRKGSDDMTSKVERKWKTMLTGNKSSIGGHIFEVGKWYSVEGEIKCCENGFHCSDTVVDAINYVIPQVVALVEVKGDYDVESCKYTKSAHRSMRVVKTWEPTHRQLVLFAIYCAEQVIGIWNKQYPDDDNPQKAIEAAKSWCDNTPTDVNASSSASFAASAYAAAYADAYASASAVARAAAAASAAAYADFNKKAEEWIIANICTEDGKEVTE